MNDKPTLWEVIANVLLGASWVGLTASIFFAVMGGVERSKRRANIEAAIAREHDRHAKLVERRRRRGD